MNREVRQGRILCEYMRKTLQVQATNPEPSMPTWLRKEQNGGRGNRKPRMVWSRDVAV